jgi:hypothetical protein
MLDQQLGLPKKNLSILFTVGSWLIFVFFVGNVYKCNLVSVVSISDSAQAPRTFYDFYQRLEYKVIFNLIGLTSFGVFNQTNNAMLQSLNLRLRNFLEVDVMNCTLQALIGPHTVCIGWGMGLASAIRGNLTLDSRSTPLLTSVDSVRTLYLTAGFRKNSPYAAQITAIFSVLGDAGLVLKLRDDALNSYNTRGVQWLKNNRDGKIYQILKEVKLNQERNDRHFTLRTLMLLVVIYVAALVISTVILLGELFIVLYHQKRIMPAAKTGKDNPSLSKWTFSGFHEGQQ